MAALSNPKHERFAQALAKGETADAAYVLAGYRPNRGNASTLKTNQSIEGRIAELHERAAIKVELGISDIIQMLQEDRDLAKKVGSPSAAVSATMGMAKVLGIVIDRNEHTGKNGGPIETRLIDDIAAVDRMIDNLAERVERPSLQ